MLHLSIYDNRVGKKYHEEEQELLRSQMKRMASKAPQSNSAALFTSLQDINADIKKNATFLKEKYNSQDVMHELSTLSLNSLYEDVDARLWNAISLLTMSKGEAGHLQKSANVAWKEKTAFDKDDSSKSKQRNVRGLP
jgi:hypothetical protein